MKTFAQELTSQLSTHSLLKHPFYQEWTDGTLPVERIRDYAAQYHHHVKAFPRYLSATHSNCENLEWRQFLLENLNDEEQGPENHPELWARFAEGLGVDRSSLAATPPSPETRALVETFTRLSRSSFEEGLGALFAYEQQVPKVAEFKIEALKSRYGVSEPRTLAFFEVHKQADIYHTETLSRILDQLPADSQAKARAAAEEAALSLWAFLDGRYSPQAAA